MTHPGNNFGLTPARRQVLAAVADVIAPTTGEMLSASAIDLAGEPVERALRARPDLAPPLQLLLDRLVNQPPTDLTRWLDRLHTNEISILMQVVAGAYYMHPAVRRILGYAGQDALTLPRGSFGGDEMLWEMMQSPPRYRVPNDRSTQDR